MKRQARRIVLSLSTALLLTAALVSSQRIEPSPFRNLLDVTVLFFGIAGQASVAVFDWVRGISAWSRHGWADYAAYFVGNLWMYCALLWGVPDSDLGRMLLFCARLPFFLALAPIFWLAVVLVSGRILASERNLDTPRRMWQSLVGWLYGDSAL